MEGEGLKGWRKSLHEIIFESDTLKGRLFDIFLIFAILISVLIVILDSVPGIKEIFGSAFRNIEWFFTIIFTIEYLLRLLSVQRPILYAKSFFGIIDLLSVLPTYLGVFIPGMHTLLILRIFRLLRVFRVLKLVRFVSEANILKAALRSSKHKITVFLLTVVSVVIFMGALMYIIEGPENGFTSIPTSMYWAIVTLTTVGFGDIVPRTILGKIISSCLMILGYGIIAVPTGIVSVELAKQIPKEVSLKACDKCANMENDLDARFCKKCGGRI